MAPTSTDNGEPRHPTTKHCSSPEEFHSETIIKTVDVWIVLSKSYKVDRVRLSRTISSVFLLRVVGCSPNHSETPVFTRIGREVVIGMDKSYCTCRIYCGICRRSHRQLDGPPQRIPWTSCQVLLYSKRGLVRELTSAPQLSVVPAMPSGYGGLALQS